VNRRLRLPVFYLDAKMDLFRGGLNTLTGSGDLRHMQLVVLAHSRGLR
jgi:hypothetical protein